MKIKPMQSVPAQNVDMPGAAGCQVRWIIDQNDGAPTFALRQFIVEPGGHTPRHQHPYEHEIVVLEGEGWAMEGDKHRPIKAGDVILVMPDEVHQFQNPSDKPMKFLCLIPNSATGKQVTVVPECGQPAPVDRERP